MPNGINYSILVISWAFIYRVIYVLLVIPYLKYWRMDPICGAERRLGVPPPKYTD